MTTILEPGVTTGDELLPDPGIYEFAAKDVPNGGVGLEFKAPDDSWVPVSGSTLEEDGNVEVVIPEETRGIRAVAETAGATAWLIRSSSLSGA